MHIRSWLSFRPLTVAETAENGAPGPLRVGNARTYSDLSSGRQERARNRQGFAMKPWQIGTKCYRFLPVGSICRPHPGLQRAKSLHHTLARELL